MAKESGLDHYKDGIFVAEAEDGIAVGAVVDIAHANGKNYIAVNSRSDSAEALNILRRGLEETFRSEPGSSRVVKLPSNHESVSGSIFGFSSSRWGGSTWNPTGPKPNWKVGPPEDPHAN